LFNGELPVNGNLAEQVSNALQSLLIERGVQGEANYLKVAQQDGPVTGFSFSVTGPTILIRNVVFNGAADEELPALESAARKVSRVEYSRSALRAQAEKDFLPIYLARGYLKAKFSDAQPSVVQSTPVEALVDVTFNVSPGLQYKAGTVEWSGNKAFPADLLGPMLNLRPGQPVDAVRLDKDLKAVQDVYGTKGYLAVSIRPIARMDDEHATANYQLQVEEGEVYVMGELDIEGVDSRTTPHLVENWKLRAGDTYDSSYPQRFYKESADLLPGTNWKMTVHQSLNRDKSVDVTLRFEPPPGGP
jgi:outer membrane protein assembly factor BamA